MVAEEQGITQANVEQMAKTPPMRMLINPTSFKVGGTKIINDGNFGRNGPIVQHWGDDRDKIDVSGKLAGFYAMDSNNLESPGLTRMARNFSASYANFLSLYLIYKNNGEIWLNESPDPLAKTSKPDNMALVGSVYILYDSTLYIGSFETFSITETDESPFTLEYSFGFSVRQSFLLDRVGSQNPNPMSDYGAPKFTLESTTKSVGGGGGAVSLPKRDLIAEQEDVQFAARREAQLNEFRELTGLGKPSTTIKVTQGKK